MAKVGSFLVLYLNGNDVGVVVVHDDVDAVFFWDLTNKNGAVPKFLCNYVCGVVVLVKVVDGRFFNDANEVVWVSCLIVAKAAVKE